MYLPNNFLVNEVEKLKAFIQKNNFATVLSFPLNELPFINHFPIIFSDRSGEEDLLIGHMAKRNPQWQHFQANSLCAMIFNGANAYITPTWYKSGRDVPTWNYAVAHLHGRIELVESFEQQIDILSQLTKFFESSRKNPWAFDLPDDLRSRDALTSAIISFKFRVEKSELKYKLSQNRSEADRIGIIEGLSERSDEQSKIIREMMQVNEDLL